MRRRPYNSRIREGEALMGGAVQVSASLKSGGELAPVMETPVDLIG